MKKMLFLMLFLLILGAANVSSQVRIGGNGQPNPAAVLDLNATDEINNGTKGLALPRVSLTNVNTALTGSPTVNGMMVYNTNASVTDGSGIGIYYWVTNKWVKMLGSDFVGYDGIVGNEVTDATAGRGLVRAGLGTTDDPYTLGVAAHAIDTGMLAAPGNKSQILAFDQGRVRMAEVKHAYVQFQGQANQIKRYRLTLPTNCISAGWDNVVRYETEGYPGVPLVARFSADSVSIVCVTSACHAMVTACCLGFID